MTTIDLITGILGAGKTTFIRKYATNLLAQGKKIRSVPVHLLHKNQSLPLQGGDDLRLQRPDLPQTPL